MAKTKSRTSSKPSTKRSLHAKATRPHNDPVRKDPVQKRQLTFQAEDSRARQGRYVHVGTKPGGRRFTDEKEAADHKREKVAEKCRLLDTQAALDSFWLKTKANFRKKFDENHKYEALAESKRDTGLQKQVVKALYRLRSEYAYVERMLATCALHRNLLNPVRRA